MLLWLMFAVLTAVVLAIVLRPAFAPAGAPATPAQAAGLAVYKDQLSELDRQVANGTLDAAERDALHHEIARRILRVSPAREPAQPSPSVASFHRALPLVIAAAVPAASLALYLALGAPVLPGRPFASPVHALNDASAAELIAKVEARLAQNPEDGRGWDVIAPIYFKFERFADAAAAYQRAIRLLGETQPRLAGLAEASVMASDGIVTEPARAAYEKLAALSPDRFEPRFWLALAKEQDGRLDAAAADYRALLASAFPDQNQRHMIELRLNTVMEKSGAGRGPTGADVQAAAKLSDSDRAAMIAGMVESLAARLKANGRDLDGWQKLIQAYATLQQTDKARASLADARAALAGNVAANRALDTLARRLELTP